MNLPAFWDAAHTDPAIGAVVDNPADILCRYLDRAGPFSATLAGAGAVLDVGPGYARLLRSLPASVHRYALEISPVARIRLGSWGIYSEHPNADRGRIRQVDLGWCISVFQHCTPAIVRALLHRVGSALRSGAEFYAQDIELKVGRQDDDLDPDTRTAAGRYTVPVGDLMTWGEQAGFQILAAAIDIPTPKEIPVAGYVVRFRRT